MILALCNSLVFSMISYYSAKYLTIKQPQILQWTEHKKKRLALIWAVLFASVLMILKWLQIHPMHVGHQVNDLFIFGMKHNLMSHCLNGCLAMSTCMGMTFYWALTTKVQSPKRHMAKHQRIKSGSFS